MKKVLIPLVLLASFLGTSCMRWDATSSDPKKGYVSVVSKEIESATFGAAESLTNLEIYGDFQCPACQRFHDLIEPRIRKDYVETKKITVTYKNFPLQQHQNAVGDALGGLCALSEGKYLEYADAMYAFEEKKSNADTSDAERLEVAKGIGVDPATFSKCLSEGWYVKKLESEKADGIRLWLDHTPSVYLNGQIMNFKSVDEFFAILEAAIRGDK